ncbi:MAG: hypothetical protein COB39_04635 [Marinosulfonomonas sp.]|nr:MAG: hypothetical protein COB39_04635 [Marinosulfonomonas sp.]
MFKRPSANQIRERDVGDRFARTAIWTFGLTYLLFPVLGLFGRHQPDGAMDGIGFGFILIWVLTLNLAATMFIPAMVCGILVFFALYKVTSNLIGPWLGAIIASSLAAYLSVLVSYHLDFNFFPMGLDWDVARGSYSVSNAIGIFAASVAVPVAAVMWIGVMHSE